MLKTTHHERNRILRNSTLGKEITPGCLLLLNTLVSFITLLTFKSSFKWPFLLLYLKTTNLRLIIRKALFYMYIFSYQKPLKRRKTFNKIVILTR